MGAGVELLLIGHFEDRWQMVPLVLLALGVMVLAWYALSPGASSIRIFRLLMCLDLGAGVAGTLLHYRGNTEFELEMHPGVQGFALFKEAMTGAFPALAPGSMVLFGLLGLAWTFRHPALPGPPRTSTKEP